MKPKQILRDYFIIFCTTLYFIFSFYGCKKYDLSPINKLRQHEFVKIPVGLDERLYGYADSLLVQEEKHSWMDSTMAALGKPGWEFTTFGLQERSPIAMVPLINDEARKVVGLLVMIKGSSGFRFRVFDARRPLRYGSNNGRNHANARTVFIAADLFNQRAFANKPSVLSDPCLMTRRERFNFEAARRSGVAGSLIVKAAPYAISISCYTTVACTGDGKGNCIGNVTYSTDCVYNYIWIDEYSEGGYEGDGGYSGGGTGGGTAGGGGNVGTSTGTTVPTACVGAHDGLSKPLIVMPPLKPINDVTAYLKCFSKAAGANITFYADQPVPGTTQYVSIKELVGHAYISIEQAVGGVVVRRTIGFYPAKDIDAVFTTSSLSAFGDDSVTEYDVKYSINVSADKLKAILTKIENPQRVYYLDSYNCASFVLDIGDVCGLKLPRTKSHWIFGEGVNPAQLGEDLRKLPGAQFGKRDSPTNVGTCK
ncbi:hypothetical protein [Chitinophaga caseinilytica]|uniref:hypothetical protein n=1 Tax=Chitinophaga caseinilytica TaxID=2267521 RepID=UPI003C30705C